MPTERFPTTPERMTAQWLESALGIGIASAEIEPVGAGAGFAGSVYRIRLAYRDVDSSAARTLIWKTASGDERTRDFLTTLGVYERELRFYQLLADKVETAPLTFFSEFDSESGAFCLIIEDLSHMSPGDQIEGCTFEQALEVVSGAGRLHSQFWSEEIGSEVSWVPTFDGGTGYFERMHSVAWRRLGRAIQGIPEGLLEVARRVGPRVSDVKARLSRTPVTLVHGDLRLDNVFFGQEQGGDGLKLIDWQAIRLGRGMYDLAYFLSTSVPVEMRRQYQTDLLEAYADTLSTHGVDYTSSDRAEDFGWALLDIVTFVGIIGSTLDFQSPRGLELSETILSRLWAAIEDSSAVDLLY